MEDTRATGAIWTRWADVVGPSIATNAEPTSLRNGVLRVRATSPAWATELTYLATEILHRANEVAGREVVREVRVWTGPGPVKPATPPTSGGALDGGLADDTRDDPEDLPTAFARARDAWARRASKRGL
jgi:hypothetical protein